MGWAPDSYNYMWNLWWTKFSLTHPLTNPFHTDYLYYPQGTDLYLHPLTFVNGVLSMPLQVTTDNVLLSWNVLSLCFFVLSGVGTYAVCHRLTGNHWAALFAGFVFAFSPFVLVRIHGQLNVGTVWPVPLFALFLMRFHDTGRFREMVGLGICWAMLTYNFFEYAIDAAILLTLFVGLMTVVYLYGRDQLKLKNLWRGAALGSVVWLTLSAPVLIPAMINVLSGEVAMRGGSSPVAEYLSADLLGYVTPSPLWGPGRFAEPDLPGQFPTPIGGVEGTVFLGITPLLLAIAGVIGCWKSPLRIMSLFWAGTFLFFAVMALGPFLYIDGDKEFSIAGLSFSISLPFRVFDNLPVVGLRRVPSRMLLYGMLGLSLAAGIGLATLISRLNGVHRWAGPLLGMAALAFIALEYWNPPVSLSEYTTPRIYDEIAEEPGDFAVLDLPVGRITGTVQRGDIIGGGLADYGQIIHRKRAIGGLIARAKEEDILWLRTPPGLKYLSCPICEGFPDSQDLNPDAVRRVLNDLQIKYVVYHRVDFEGLPTSFERDGTAAAIQDYLERVAGLTVIDSDERFIAYRNEGVE